MRIWKDFEENEEIFFLKLKEFEENFEIWKI
jgi:hypothetical protein